jgi:endonuclease/exonuclease/phosphatase family metal-dependent hydrolase
MTTPPRTRNRLLALAAGLALTLGWLVPSPAAVAAADPRGLRATVATKSIGLDWDGDADSYYQVKILIGSTWKSWKTQGTHFEWRTTDPNPTSSAPRLSPDTTYQVKVRQLNADREYLSDYSDTLSVTTADSGYPELAPVDVRTTEAGAEAVHISWSDRGPGVSYRVRYGTSSDLNADDADVADFDAAGGTVTGLKASTTYYFKVRVIERGNSDPLSDFSAVVKRTTAAKTTSPAITLVSQNIHKSASGPAWSGRRDDVGKALTAQRPDIIALQEATRTKVKDASGNSEPQYKDMLDVLNKYAQAGADYKYASDVESGGVHIAYNTDRLTVERSGVVVYDKWLKTKRYAAWAVLKDKLSGKQVFVVDTHLEPGSGKKYQNARVAQAKELVAAIKAENTKDLPVILAGDMNSNRSTNPDNGPYLAYADAGLADPLGNSLPISTGDCWMPSKVATAEHQLDVAYNSVNHLKRHAIRTAFPLGTYVDYIFTSRDVRVALMRQVVDVDTSGDFVGTIPSDHNMLMVTVHLA